jgi:AraC-like DNA-binding protein/mannose-6-phosphate isomerase-like protein (cupin superfamily)
MHITSKPDDLNTLIKHFPIPMDSSFPINVPYINRLHYSPEQPLNSRMHYHDSTELGICRCGSGIFYIGNQVCPFSAGDVTVVSPGTLHIAHSDQQTAGWQFIDIDYSRLSTRLPAGCGDLASNFNGVIPKENNSKIASLMDFLLKEFAHDQPYMKASVLQYAGQLAIELARRTDESLKGLETSIQLYEISPAILYISNFYNTDFTVKQLADLCNRSVSSFRRAFTAATGQTPFNYLYQVRIKTAINLLRESELSISEIAGLVGYNSISSFNRHFIKFVGLPPSRMRQELAGDEK